MGWRHLHVGQKGDNLTIQNRRVWQEEWRWINAETVRLPDPLVPMDILSHMICEIGPRPARALRRAQAAKRSLVVLRPRLSGGPRIGIQGEKPNKP